MKNIIIIILSYCFIAKFILKLVYAENNVIINEFLIDPQPQQVEILNTSSQNIDISNWYLDDNGGTTYGTIPQNTILYSNSCYVYIGDLNLNKSSIDIVRLFNSTAPPTSSNAALIDSHSYKSSPGTGIGYNRFPDGQNIWISTASSIGKFNSNHQPCITTPTATPTAIPTVTPTPTIKPTELPTPTPTIFSTPTTMEQSSNETVSITPSPTPSPTTTITPIPEVINNIYISEVMVHPKSDDKEWVEVFNDNDFDVSLYNWYIDDLENAGSLPKRFTIFSPSKSYSVIELSSPIFNDAGDEIRLLDQNKNLKDGFEYSSSIEDSSYGRITFDSSEFCLQTSSKGNPNNPCISPTSSTKSVSSSSLSPSPTTQQIKQLSPTTAIHNKSQSISPSTNIKNNVYKQAQTITSNKGGEILGASTHVDSPFFNKKNIMFTSFISFFYSILTIVYVSIKMKLSYEKSCRFYSSSLYSKRRKQLQSKGTSS